MMKQWESRILLPDKKQRRKTDTAVVLETAVESAKSRKRGWTQKRRACADVFLFGRSS